MSAEIDQAVVDRRLQIARSIIVKLCLAGGGLGIGLVIGFIVALVAGFIPFEC